MPPNPNTLAAVVPAELCAAKTNTFSASEPELRRTGVKIDLLILQMPVLLLPGLVWAQLEA